MAGRKSDFTLPTLDDLFSTQELRDAAKLSRIRDIPLELIDDFPDHPFKVRDDEDMIQLVESVKERGVITPATVRQKEDGILPFAAILAAIVGLLVLEPHFSASIIIVAIGGVMLFLGGARLIWFIAAAVAAGGGIAVLLTMFPYASTRITTWRDPFASTLPHRRKGRRP